MSDMRKKLLPVFLEEAGRKIEQLDAFISGNSEIKTLADLDVAFRAAHTLKGTAALVQADAVRSLSGRIEGLLEGHFEQNRLPSEIEYEAMQLALDRLRRLIEAVASGSDEPAGVLAEAEMALKLATAMPGLRRLSDLLDPQDSQDPFAEDPLLAEAVEPLPVSSMGQDPFADDPEPEQTPPDILTLGPDPFAGDPGLDGDTTAESRPDITQPPAVFNDIADPFADDPALEYVQAEPYVEQKDLSPEVSPVTSETTNTEPELDDAGTEELAPQQSSFIDRMRERIEKESPLQTAERLAKTLLSQAEGDLNTRQYSCCHFSVAEKDYYLPIANMIEISDLPKIIHLPLAPEVVRGLINLRGQVLPVIDLGIQSGGSSKYVPVRKLVIAEAGGETLAFLCDGIPSLAEEFLGEKVDVMNFVDQFRAGVS